MGEHGIVRVVFSGLVRYAGIKLFEDVLHHRFDFSTEHGKEELYVSSSLVRRVDEDPATVVFSDAVTYEGKRSGSYWFRVFEVELPIRCEYIKEVVEQPTKLLTRVNGNK